MADKKISELTAAAAAALANEYPINESGTTKKVTGTQMKAIFRGAGTSFPGSPTTGDTYLRTDISSGMEFIYDGTRWVSVDLIPVTFGAYGTSSTYATTLTATATSVQRCDLTLPYGTDAWIDKIVVQAFVNSGGTALGASHKWVGTLNKINTANSTSSLGTVNIDSGSSNEWKSLTLTVGALLGAYIQIRLDWAKTGTPGDINITSPAVCYFRIVST